MVVVVACAITSVMITHANQLKIKQIGQAGLNGTTKVNLDGKWVEVSSEDLVPGVCCRPLFKQCCRPLFKQCFKLSSRILTVKFGC